MHWAPRPILVILQGVLVLGVGLCSGPGAPDRSPLPSGRTPTVEPTLPLTIELRLAPDRGPGGSGRAVLHAGFQAGSEIADLVLVVHMPPGLRFEGAALPDRLGPMAAGDRLVHTLPLLVDRAGAYPIRIEADVKLADGRSFRVGYGEMLRIGPSDPPGWLHNGAYEIRGVPLRELMP